MKNNNFQRKIIHYQILYYKKEFVWLNIPYKEEIKSMLYYLHNKNNHLKHEAMSSEVISMGFYWNGYTNDIIKLTIVSLRS